MQRKEIITRKLKENQLYMLKRIINNSLINISKG